MIARLLETPHAYNLWQRFFARTKIEALEPIPPFLHVLDIGCGPGTNSAHFAKNQYTGIDINPRYIEFARKRHRGNFIVGDVTHYDFSKIGTFEVILLNSFLHHISDDSLNPLLHRAKQLLSEKGHVYIIDMFLPDRFGPAYVLSRLDRGAYVRRPDHWKALLGKHFSCQDFREFNLSLGPVPLWKMFYFKGS